MGVAFGESEDAGDHAHRKRECQPADEIGTTGRRERVDQLVDDTPDELVLPPCKELGTERRRDERPKGPVFGFVHRDHRVLEHGTHDVDEHRGRIGLVVAQYGHHLVVAEHAERRVAVLVDGPDVVGEWPIELHRAFSPGGRKMRIRIVGGAELDRVGQLERIETPRGGIDLGRHVGHACASARSQAATLKPVRSCLVACIPRSIRDR